MSKKEMLDNAFRDAVTVVDVNAFEGEGVIEEILATSMRAYAEKENVEFTDERCV